MNTKAIDAKTVIKTLALEPHPEGGFYKRTSASEKTIETHRGIRPVMTSIFYLLELGDRSKFHRLLQSEERWFFHLGDGLDIYELKEEGFVIHELGCLSENRVPSLSVSENTWFGCRPAAESKYGFTLVSCTVVPGFDFDDFEMAEAQILEQAFPKAKCIIKELT